MLTISGTGCALMDYLYADVRLDSEAFVRYRSRTGGDGGLEPANLCLWKISSASQASRLQEFSKS